MTNDSNIINALECMASVNENGLCYAEQENIKRMKENMPYIICGNTEDGKFECCPYYQDQFDTCMSDGSQQKALKMAVDLINRQNVEIERLQEQLGKIGEHSLLLIQNAIVEAIKEFADKILEEAVETGSYFAVKSIITSVKKEMVG